MRCIDCALMTLTEDSTLGPRVIKLAAHGFGRCRLAPKWEYVSARFERDCPSFKPASADDLKKRAKWAAKFSIPMKVPT